MKRPSRFLVAILSLNQISFLYSADATSLSVLPKVAPQEVGLDAAKLARIDLLVNEEINRGKLPGAVVLVLRHGKIGFCKAYGRRSIEPSESPMTIDTVFDLASLTKPIATATSVMILLEQGKLRLEDRMGQYFPPFSQNGKDKVTIEHLLLHTSGLLADNPLADYLEGEKKALERIHQLPLVADPGKKFIYSDVGFILLGKLVEQISGETLDVFAGKNIFQPLGLRETGFNPAADFARRCAPTEKREGRWLQGEVHDPRAHLLGGVAGHAGLFSTAGDLALYAQMILNQGSLGEKRILSPATARLMITPRLVPGGRRALGWDVRTTFSSNRGELFGEDSFGHTGFTGTSIWLDPASGTGVIFLSNRVHPDGKGDVKRLRGRVATLVAGSIVTPPFPDATKTPFLKPDEKSSPRVLCGIDVLKQDGFRQLKNRKIGLVTNHTGVDREGQTTIDLLHQTKGVNLVALFSPEHGIRGQVDRLVADSKDEKTGLPIYSLYGQRQRPAA
ncbi:MAG TPA: serine hydrolase, partial [Gemmataceae bacterium]|nr:serine hydrolase [Gemmataceae bacterium]